jgi:hypothetical protein
MLTRLLARTAVVAAAGLSPAAPAAPTSAATRVPAGTITMPSPGDQPRHPRHSRSALCRARQDVTALHHWCEVPVRDDSLISAR